MHFGRPSGGANNPTAYSAWIGGGSMPEEGPVGVLWEGGSCSGGVGPIPSSKDGMGDNSPNNCGVGGRMSDLGHGCGVG